MSTIARAGKHGQIPEKRVFLAFDPYETRSLGDFRPYLYNTYDPQRHDSKHNTAE